jgi:hypothetical protein
LDILDAVLSAKADWPAALKDGRALYAACKRGDLWSIERLAGAGACLEAVLDDACPSVSPLRRSVEHGRWSSALKLLELGAKPDGEGGRQSVLARAVSSGPRVLVEALLEAGADPNAKSCVLRCVDLALNECARMSQCADFAESLKVLSALLAAGARVDGVDDAGCTALMRAGASGRLDMVEALLAAGADAGKRSAAGEWASMIAAESGMEGAAVRLLSAAPPVAGGTWKKLGRLAAERGMSELAGMVASRKEGREIAEVARPRRGSSRAGKRSVRI